MMRDTQSPLGNSYLRIISNLLYAKKEHYIIKVLQWKPIAFGILLLKVLF